MFQTKIGHMPLMKGPEIVVSHTQREEVRLGYERKHTHKCNSFRIWDTPVYQARSTWVLLQRKPELLRMVVVSHAVQ